MSNYQTFAQLYQSLFDPSVYEQWVDFVASKTQPSSLLDIGGGNGEIGSALTKKGYEVSILDISSEMLELAAQKPGTLNLYEADMRDFDIDNKFAVIISTTDSLNYLETKKELQTTFKNIFNHLADDGLFLFDVITPHMVNVTYDNYMYNNDDDLDRIFMWSSFPGEQKDSIDHDLKFFIYDENIDGYKVVREVHHEQTFDVATYEGILKEVGFKDIKISSEYGHQQPTPETDRLFFEVTK